MNYGVLAKCSSLLAAFPLAGQGPRGRLRGEESPETAGPAAFDMHKFRGGQYSRSDGMLIYT